MKVSAVRKSWLKLERDLLIILAVFFATLWAVNGGLLDYFLSTVQEQYIIASFISGIFFTSVFTIAPAAIVISHISSEHVGPLMVAIPAGVGAMLGDAALFLFVRDVFAADVEEFLRVQKLGRFLHYLRIGRYRWFAPVVGAFIILSPLPDELGLALLGFARVPLWVVLAGTFVLNTIVIYFVVILASHF